MKKWISLLLAACMMLSMLMLTACENPFAKLESGDTVEELAGKTPEELYAAALVTVSELENYSLESTQDILMTMGSETYEMRQTVVAKKAGSNEYLKTENDMTADANMECWYVDGMFYAIVSGQSYKAALDYEDYVEKYMPEGSTSDSALLNIPEAWFVDTKFVFEGDDTYYLEFIVSGSEFMDYVGSAAASGLDYSAAEDVSYKVYFDKEGNLGKIITEFSFEIEGVLAECYAVSEISDINTTTITPPEDGDTWMDVTGSI